MFNKVDFQIIDILNISNNNDYKWFNPELKYYLLCLNTLIYYEML